MGRKNLAGLDGGLFSELPSSPSKRELRVTKQHPRTLADNAVTSHPLAAAGFQVRWPAVSCR